MTQYHAVIKKDGHKTHLSAETPSRLAETVGREVERFVDTQVTMPGGTDAQITITPYALADSWAINEQTGQWENPLPKTRRAR